MRARISATIAVLVLALFSPFQSPSASAVVADGVGVVTSNLLMYYDLGNPSGINGTTLTDLSGNGYSGTIIQTSSQPSLNTAQGKYLSFAGSGTTGGYVDVPDIVSGSNWTGFSASFYANMGTGTVVERIFDFGMGSSNNNIWVGMGDGHNMAAEIFQNAASQGWCRSAANSVVDNEWAQWTVTFDGTNCLWYKNNSLSSTTAYTYLPLAKTLNLNYIGDSNWTVDPSFEGGIGELAIYKSTLNSTERTQNYNAQTDITAPNMVSPASPYSVSMPETSTSGILMNVPTASYFSIIGGADSAAFMLSGAVLSIRTQPNFEAPTDTAPFNSYIVTVRTMDANGNYSDWTITVNVTDAQEPASLTVPSLSATPYKGIAVTITVTPSGDGTSIPGKITYLIGGKRIPSCYKKTYSGTGSSTCTFDPALRGSQDIEVTFTPTNTNFTAATAKMSYFFSKRTTTR